MKSTLPSVMRLKLKQFRICLIFTAFLSSTFLPIIHTYAEDVLTSTDETTTTLPLNFSSRTTTHRGQLSLGVEGSTIILNKVPLNGGGSRLGFEYALTDRWSVNANLSLVFSVTGATFLYSGIDSVIRYSPFGTFSETHEEVLRDGKAIATQTIPRTNRLSVGLGVEQLFLNGSQQVYPAAGVSGSVAYSFPFFSKWFEASVKMAQLTMKGAPVQSYFFNLSYLLGL